MRHSLDFTIYEDGDINSILFIDKSEYYESPSNPLIEVSFPNRFDEVFSIIGIPQRYNVLNTKNLNEDICSNPFPDGVYKIRYSVSPNATLAVCKYILRSTSLNKRIKQILCNSELERELIESLYRIDLLIMQGEAEAEDKNVSKASEYYNKANKLLKKLECNV